MKSGLCAAVENFLFLLCLKALEWISECVVILNTVHAEKLALTASAENC